MQENDYSDADAPIRDSASGERMRDAMVKADVSIGGLLDLMLKYGDDRSPRTLMRSIQRMRSGATRMPGEMRVILNILQKQPEIPR